MRPIFWVVLLFIFYTVSGDPCEIQETCSKCIRNPRCVWCAKAEYEGIRCKTVSSEIETQCPNDLQNMRSTAEVTRNDPFTSSTEKVIQISPQNIKLKLRVGDPINFSFKYKQAENYPVDLYFLLDVSTSMEKIKDVLLAQSQQIYNAMKKFTNKIRLGIGTFIDKNIFPFVSNPDVGGYSFRNQLPLTVKVDKFKVTLNKTKFIGNLDTPEGGLDALGQVLACSEGTDNIIGWNHYSRKIVLFITDDEYHAAGDGIIAGIYKPYDGKCYTGHDGIYKKQLEMDYPSVAMIKKLVNKIGAIVIFVAKDDVSKIYLDLANAMNGKRQEYDVQKPNTQFDEILKEVYEEKTNTIILRESNNAKVNNLYELTFTPDCTTLGNDDCTVKFREEKSFTGSLTLNKYDDKIKNFNIDVQIDGLNEKLQLDIEVTDSCECEATVENNAPTCKSHGALKCGVCDCDTNWFGPYCNCTQDYDPDDNSASCKRKGDDRVCSGNGDCVCGACVCHSHGNEQKYSGKYCHCDSDSCPRKNNQICSNHGSCQCGVCVCGQSWAGDACDISLLKTNCMKDNVECNGRGKCYNNNCKCDQLPEWDERNVNSLCVIVHDATVHKRQCKALEELVLCTYEEKGSCSNTEKIKISKAENAFVDDKTSWNVCDSVRVSVGCYIPFGYKYDDKHKSIDLLIDTKPDCAQTYYMYGGITFGSLLLIGLGTLIGWKILTTMQDRREYERFLQSQKKHGSIRHNVLYTSPKVQIDNPAYVGSSSTDK